MNQNRNVPGVDQGKAMTFEQLKAGIQDSDPEQIGQQLDQQVTEFMLEHRVSADTLKKQVSV
ncbi:MAG TPA: hypothetical protein VGG89_14475 [Candidatus Baltobacteraceae bacterium]